MASSRPAQSVLTFLGYSLDADDAQLRNGREVVPLRPKTLAVLTHLIGNPGRLVTKSELLDAVWPGTAVSESVLTSCIKELRQALDDDPRRPRAIETAHRRGYRFIAPIDPIAAPAVPRPATIAAAHEPSHLLGRAAEVGELESWLEAALRGVRQMGFVVGEPGIGKTALVESLLERIAARDGERQMLIARGQCVELHGSGEPYLPVLDALERLCGGASGAPLVELLRRHAPTWLLQLPSLLGTEDVAALERSAAGSSGARMPRELAAFIEALPVPLILLLEDLHWSDHATVDLLSILARRRDPARLLVVGTYRPVDIVVSDHPLKRLNQQLRERSLCRDLWLQPLGERDIADYVDARWPGIDGTALVRILYERTDGNPLFLVNVAEYLVATGAIARGDGGWAMHSAAAVGTTVPLGLRQMIAAQLDRVEAPAREVLEAGSLAGRSFSAALVAAALERDVVEVEGGLSRLAEREHFVRAAGLCEWPDGTAAGQYELTHFLYRSVLGAGVPPARARQLHARLAARLEEAYGPRAVEIGGELAFHFERSGQVDRASPYLEAIAARAVRRGAAREAVETLRHALSLLEAAPPSQARAQNMISASIALGAALPALNGFADLEIEHAFLRARELSEEIGDRFRLFQSLIALTANYISRARLMDARDSAAAIERLMEELSVPMLTFGGSLIVGMERFHAGSLADARCHLERAAELSGVPTPALSLDMVVLVLDYLALTLLHQGYPDQARVMCERAAARAAEVGRPFDRGSAAQIACFAFLMLRDFPSLARAADAAIWEGTEHSLPAIRAIGEIARGRVQAAAGESAEGIAAMHRGIEAYAATGQRIALPSTLAALAAALLEAGEADRAREVIAEAQDLVESTGERRLAPELYRLEGEMRRMRGDAVAAERSLRRAVELANAEGARWLGLRATTGLARLLRDAGKHTQALELLAPVCAAFDEGADTADLIDARTLLAELERER